MLGWLKRWWDGPLTGDGFGQSLADDARYFTRYREARRRAIEWRRPTWEEARYWDEHPLAGRFGDFTHAVSEAEGRVWVARERIWHGWPDPPEYAMFVWDGDEVWSAADFDTWPSRWSLPPREEGGEALTEE